jgi:recombination protein RecR
MFSPLIDDLINALRYLPGIGPKSAQRIAFHLLDKGRSKGLELSQCLSEALRKVKHCQQCRTFSELSLCKICANPKRDSQICCIVKTPLDLAAIEQTQTYHGKYFVLMGHLSPLEGIGANELGIPAFIEQVKRTKIKEIILATSSTVEGETTAHYLAEQLKTEVQKITRLAHGIPLGNEVESIDHGTLMRALLDRQDIRETY